jgi:hypothetical protein
MAAGMIAVPVYSEVNRAKPRCCQSEPIGSALMRPQLIAEAMIVGLPPALVGLDNGNRLNTDPPGICHRAIGIEIERNPDRIRRALVEIRGLHVPLPPQIS